MIIKEIKVEDIRKYLDKIFDKYNCEKDYSFLGNKIIIEYDAKFRTIEIFEKNENANRIIKELQRLGFYPYSIGEPILVIDRKYVKPTLPLARHLKGLCKNILIIKEKELAYKLTYGKEVVVREEIPNGFYLAFDSENNFLSYVRVKREKRYVKIIPELDIGWYLRKGG